MTSISVIQDRIRVNNDNIAALQERLDTQLDRRVMLADQLFYAEKPLRKVGDLFTPVGGGSIYILSQTAGGKVAAIGLMDGSNRFRGATIVSDPNKITEEEMVIIGGLSGLEYYGNYSDYTLEKK